MNNILLNLKKFAIYHKYSFEVINKIPAIRMWNKHNKIKGINCVTPFNSGLIDVFTNTFETVYTGKSIFMAKKKIKQYLK